MVKDNLWKSTVIIGIALFLALFLVINAINDKALFTSGIVMTVLGAFILFAYRRGGL